MSVISTTNVNPLAPIDRTSETTPLAERYNEQRVDIYGKFSIYQDGTRRRNSEPFLFTDLNQPNSIKLRRKNDSQTLPFRSAIDDVQRMSRFLRSGRGILFSAQQFLIQNQNAFNETRVWNPASILTAAASTPLLRIRPVRHIETSGSLGGILTNFLRGSIGLTPTKSNPSGTATSSTVISTTAKTGGPSNWPEKGLVRYNTAVGGQNNFNLRYGSSIRSRGFFSKIVDNFLKTLPFVGTLTKKADWSLRPEYSGKINVYRDMIEDRSGLLSFKSVDGVLRSVNNIQKFTSFSLYSDDIKRERDDLPLIFFRSEYQTPLSGNIIALAGIDNNKTSPDGDDVLNRFTFDSKKTSDQLYYGGDGGSPPVKDRLKAAIDKFNQPNDTGKKYQDINKSFYTDAIISYEEIGTKKRVPVGTFADIEKKHGFSSVGKPDEINILFPIEEDEKALGIPGALKSSDNSTSKDLIYFYFYDVANKVYLPFRATIESISDNNAAEWEDFQYIGRADKLFIYRGFTRDINFNFTVHANSVFELQPMWHRINYLTGLTRPSKYTESPNSQSSGEFIVPPLVKLRVGDLYVDLPIVIRSIGITIPETATWELTSGEEYKYRGINAKATTAQLPMTVQLQINAAVLEKERSEGGFGTDEYSKTRFFGSGVKGFERQRGSTVSDGDIIR
jgi:hypothetical protein